MSLVFSFIDAGILTGWFDEEAIHRALCGLPPSGLQATNPEPGQWPEFTDQSVVTTRR
jgi:hypothetical protein